MTINKLTLLICLISCFTFGQVGIKTETPSATLDIVSDGNTSATKAVEINNAQNQQIFNVYDNGNIYIKRNVLPADKSGNKDDLLVSKGNNLSPEWVKNPLGNIFDKVIAVAFYANQATPTPSSSYNSATSHKLSFSNINLSTPEIGTWNISTNEFTVQKTGIYHITTGVNLTTQNSSTTRTGTLWIYAASYRQGVDAIREISSNYDLSASGVLTAYLSAGEKITVYASASTNWRVKNGFLNISYSKPSNP